MTGSVWGLCVGVGVCVCVCVCGLNDRENGRLVKTNVMCVLGGDMSVIIHRH